MTTNTNFPTNTDAMIDYGYIANCAQGFIDGLTGKPRTAPKCGFNRLGKGYDMGYDSGLISLRQGAEIAGE